MIRKPYPTDLTDTQWARIAPSVPPAMPGARRRTVNVRQVVNAILYYFVRTGCQWRNLPHDFPPWGTRSTITTAAGVSIDGTSGKRFTTLCASRLGARKRGAKLPRVRP